jgi:hypothetical protein
VPELTELPESQATWFTELHDDVTHELSVTWSQQDSVLKDGKESEIIAFTSSAAMSHAQFAPLL